MSEILGLVGPNISTTTEIFGPGGQNIMGDQISCDRLTSFTHSLFELLDDALVQLVTQLLYTAPTSL